MIQVFLQRSRSHYRQEPPAEPVFLRSFPESSDYMRQLAIRLSENANEEPLNEADQNSDEEMPPVMPNPEPLQDLLQRMRNVNNLQKYFTRT